MKVKNLHAHCRTLILIRTFSSDTEMYIVTSCLILIPYFTSVRSFFLAGTNHILAVQSLLKSEGCIILGFRFSYLKYLDSIIQIATYMHFLIL